MIDLLVAFFIENSIDSIVIVWLMLLLVFGGFGLGLVLDFCVGDVAPLFGITGFMAGFIIIFLVFVPVISEIKNMETLQQQQQDIIQSLKDSFASLSCENQRLDILESINTNNSNTVLDWKKDMYDYSCHSFKPSSEFETIQEIKN